eukprot:114215-Prymnesium_polylepis.1
MEAKHLTGGEPKETTQTVPSRCTTSADMCRAPRACTACSPSRTQSGASARRRPSTSTRRRRSR